MGDCDAFDDDLLLNEQFGDWLVDFRPLEDEVDNVIGGQTYLSKNLLDIQTLLFLACIAKDSSQELLTLELHFGKGLFCLPDRRPFAIQGQKVEFAIGR